MPSPPAGRLHIGPDDASGSSSILNVGLGSIQQACAPPPPLTTCVYHVQPCEYTTIVFNKVNEVLLLYGVCAASPPLDWLFFVSREAPPP